MPSNVGMILPLFLLHPSTHCSDVDMLSLNTIRQDAFFRLQCSTLNVLLYQGPTWDRERLLALLQLP